MTVYLAHSAKDGIPEQTYRQHVTEVLRMACGNAEKAAIYSAFGPLLKDAVEHAAAYHDLGKLDEGNQQVLRSSKGKLPVKHWDAGAAYLMSYSKCLANRLAALFVYSHHVGLPSLVEEGLKKAGMFRESSAMDKTVADLSIYLEAHLAELGDNNVSEYDWKGKSATPLFMRVDRKIQLTPHRHLKMTP